MKKNKLVSNFGFNIIYELTTILSSLLMAPFLTRTLTAEKLGEYTYINSIISYFVLFAMLGFSILGNRAIAYIRDDRLKLNMTFSRIYITQTITSITSLVCFIIFGKILQMGTIYYIIGLLIVSCIFDVSWFFKGMENFKLFSILNTSTKIIGMLLTFILINDKNDLLTYALIMSLVTLIGNLCGFCIALREIHFTRISAKSVLFTIKEALILFVPVISASVYKMMDKLMIGSMTHNLIGVSNYSYAEQMVNIPSGIITALSSVALPRMANLSIHSRTENKNIIANKILIASCCISCAISFGLASISKNFVPLYLGDEYYDSANYLVLLSITSILSSWTAMMRNLFLLPAKKDRVYITSVVMGACLNFILNILLIKKYAIYGAIIATIASELLVTIIQTIAAAQQTNMKKHILNVIPFFFIGIIMLVVCKTISSNLPLNWSSFFVLIGIGAIVYLALSIGYLLTLKKYSERRC